MMNAVSTIRVAAGFHVPLNSPKHLEIEPSSILPYR